MNKNKDRDLKYTGGILLLVIIVPALVAGAISYFFPAEPLQVQIVSTPPVAPVDDPLGQISWPILPTGKSYSLIETVSVGGETYTTRTAQYLKGIEDAFPVEQLQWQEDVVPVSYQIIGRFGHYYLGYQPEGATEMRFSEESIRYTPTELIWIIQNSEQGAPGGSWLHWAAYGSQWDLFVP